MKASDLKRGLRAFFSHVAESAQDRPKHLANFFMLWEGAARSIDSVAEQLLQVQEIDFTRKLWDALTAPYSPIQIIRFTRLMDHLELEEEERFLAACAALDAAWQKFFSTVLTRHPQLVEAVVRLEAARHDAHDAVVPLFTGEAKPLLTPAWGKAMKVLDGDYGALEEGLRK